MGRRFGLLVLAVMACASVGRGAQPATQPVRVIGKIEKKGIAECSGVVASRRHPGVFWVHNDNGNKPELYAITREGKLLADLSVGPNNEDWEDIAIDDAGHLYLGDIGNNGAKRKELYVYRFKEPDPAKQRDKKLKATAKWTLKFPAQPFDCEALFVHQGFGYVVTKYFTGLRAEVYRFALDETKPQVVLERVTSLPIHAPVTAADISPDGKRLAVLTNAGLSIFPIDGDVTRAPKVTPSYIQHWHKGTEACCFVDDGVLVIAETREIFLFTSAPPPP